MTEYNFTVPGPGSYHVVSGGARPHPASECGPGCEPFPGLAEGTMTVVEMDTVPADAMPRPFLSAALTEVAPEVIQRFQAAWDELMSQPQEHRVLCKCGAKLPMSELAGHQCEASAPRSRDYPVGGGADV